MNQTMLHVSLAVATLVLGGCSALPPVGDPGNTLRRDPSAPDQIHWPEQYKPEDAGFFVHNEIIIRAPPSVVWDILVQAETWPSFYEGASNVKVLNAPDKQLHDGTVFAWTTMDLDFESTIKEFEVPARLSWESRKSTIKGYHGWLLIPAGSGTKVVTEESQHGFLTTMQKLFVPNKLRLLHDIWLAQIKKRAEIAAGTWIEPAVRMSK